jgi:hypothetical protein
MTDPSVVKVVFRDGLLGWARGEDGLHRRDAPAFISPDGQTEGHSVDGREGRFDGPAFVTAAGATTWYSNGRLVRRVRT